MNQHVHYKPYLRKFAQKLRKNMTFGEVALWQKLRKKQMRGFRFIRQKPIDKYIVNFYCPKLQLIIELDGPSHDETRYNSDIKRENKLESLGITVLRFEEREVLSDVDNVLFSIESWIEEHTPNS